MAETALSVHGLAVAYDSARVLHGVDLHVDPGEVVALLGANGAGKTTTLRTISGLVRPQAGHVAFEGSDMDKLSPTARARLGIAHVPDGRGLFSGLTVAEHLRLSPRGETLDAQIVYDHFPALSEIRNRRAGLLSGGEQQMLAVGRALARKPRLLLLDELSLGLAPVIVERLLPVVHAYAKEASCGVLMVEQHVHLALEIADRCYVLSRGELTMEKTGAELLANPDHLVSSYLGGAE